MQKKHQIFISSTFLEMKEERQAAVEAILDAGHIPAGMELFAAGNEEQIKVIERWIDESDIYLLILGARYGQINPENNKSYTEHEYDYAIQKGKPYFSLVLSDKALKSKEEKETQNIGLFNKFREKVLNKISANVDDCKDIKIQIMKSIKLLENKNDIPGWVRSTDKEDLQPLLDTVKKLTDENINLRNKFKEEPTSISDLAGINEKFKFSISYLRYWGDDGASASAIDSWGGMLSSIGPSLLSPMSDNSVSSLIARIYLESNKDIEFVSCKLYQEDFDTIKIHFMALKYINVANGFWILSELGKQTLLKIKSVKKSK